MKGEAEEVVLANDFWMGLEELERSKNALLTQPHVCFGNQFINNNRRTQQWKSLHSFLNSEQD